MNTEWKCPNCNMSFENCTCGPSGDNDADEKRDDRDTGEDLPGPHYEKGYNCPSTRPPIDPIHVQHTRQR